ncbi:Spy/CpxP family protein refolding chaperone [Paracidovorax wautersii]|uniref:LTXXQ motif family protein n=1 Tax=Paracidovorax wautersii TaxID=1177982 RepID=A0A1I2AL43_9BURK|nr:Spy/CpxP family protein refolding chaperone [Paracidovorax wautersii]SFE44469.1 LTXXQ motif family protein [Paracidovorax wautersii]
MANALQQRLASTTLATALLVALAAPAFAQTAAAPAAPAPTASQPAADGAKAPRQGERRAHSPEERQQRMERHASELKQKLQITPAQESAWTAFTTAMQPPADAQARHEALRDLDKLTTPERIDRLRALRTQHAAEADRRDEAVKTFYAALTPAQQKVFDAESARMHQRMAGPDGAGPRGPKAGGEHPRHGGPAAKPGSAAPGAPAAPQ